MNVIARMAAILLSLALSSCSHYIDAEPFSQIKSGQTFDRQGAYRLNPGDVVNVLVYGDDKLTGEYTVSSAGFLAIPLIPPVQAAGLTATQLGKKIRNALRVLIKKPRVTASITGAKNFRVFFAGEVNSVGVISLTNETSLLQALTMAGGLNDYASGRIVLVRKIAGQKIRRYSTDYEDILSGRGQLDRLNLEAGDVLIAE